MKSSTIIPSQDFWRETSWLLSFFCSLLVHALLFLFFGATLLRLHHHEERTSSIATPPEIVFDLSAPSPQRPVVDSNSMHPLEKPPEQTSFQSDANSAGTSELPPTGKDPLPTQQGSEQDTLSLHQEDPSVAENNKSSIADVATLPSTTKDRRDAKTLSTTATLSDADQPVMGHLSSASKKSQETARTSIIRGSISNRGPASVAAEATPLGRYKKTLSEAISSRWHDYVDHQMEFLNLGTATISFSVTQEGKIEKLQLLSNSSNQSFADCCLKSIMEAKLPEIPAEVAVTLEGKKLDVEYRFTICSD